MKVNFLLNHYTLHNYVGLTYPKFFQGKFARAVWKKFLCSKKMHLFDECASIEHVLHCDACELSVHIALVETEEESCNRSDRSCYVETWAIEKSEIDPDYLKIISETKHEVGS